VETPETLNEQEKQEDNESEDKKGKKFYRYLKKLFKLRMKWGGPWTKFLFTLGIQSTQRKILSNDRSESMNRYVKAYTDHSSSLPDFVENIETFVKTQRVILPILFFCCCC